MGHHISSDTLCQRKPLQMSLLLQLNKYILNNWTDKASFHSRAVEE